MGIGNLSKPGSKFNSSVGPGSFFRKLSSMIRYGKFSNLKDNMTAIKKSLKPYERYIRRGGLSRLQKLSIWRKIKSRDKNLTLDDARDIKKILDHLSK